MSTTIESPLLDLDEAAEYLRRPKSWLADMRYERKGPPYTKIGKSVYYRRAALDAFIAASEHPAVISQVEDAAHDFGL